jgi:NAD(P)H-hydrate repair Nnr-like enzyme with NAD(P)H-hydrate epimerase domain
MRSRQPRPFRSILRATAALTATGLLLAACGGDGGDGATAGSVLHALIINASDADVTVSYTGADAPDVTQATCSADLHDFPLADPFTIAIDGKTVLDSDVDLPDGIPNDGASDLIVSITIAKDGTASFDRVRPGSALTKPSKAAYCPTMPG